MRRHLTALLVPSVLVFLYAVGCGAPNPPELVLDATPRAFPDAGVVRVRAQAFTGDGKVGTGTVQLQSTAGSLMGGVDLTLDSFGTATTDLECPQTEAACRTVVRVVGTWTSQGQKAEAELRIGQSNPTGSGGGGGSTGTGGGAGGASGGFWTPRKPNVCQPAADNLYHPGIVNCCSSIIPLCTSIVMTDQAKVKVHFLPPGTTMPPGQELELTAVAPSITDSSCGVSFGLLGPNSTPLKTGVAVGAIRSDGVWTPPLGVMGNNSSFIPVPATLCTEWNKAETSAIYLMFNWGPDGMGGYSPKADLQDGTWNCYPAIVDGGATDEPTQFVVVIRK